MIETAQARLAERLRAYRRAAAITVDAKLERCRRTGMWVGSCPALGLRSQGETPEDARRAIVGAVLLFVKHGVR